MPDKISIYDTTFIVCDVETTGLSPEYNRITEIALIKVQGGEIIDRYSTLVNPGQHIPLSITALTGISNEDVIDKPDFEELSEEIISFISSGNIHVSRTKRRLILPDDIVFVGHNAAFDYNFVRESFMRMRNPMDIHIRSLCTCKLARRLLRRLKSKSLSHVSNYLGVRQVNKHRAYDDTLATSHILIHFLDRLMEEYDYEHLYQVLKFQNSRIYTETSKSPALKRLKISLKDLPVNPGVYFMQSRDGEILYIGKAKNLKERLSSYFRHNSEQPYKIRKLLARVHALEWEITSSELSALILESKMIKKHKPRFNSAMKRYKFHPFLKIDVQSQYPRIEKVYEIENDGANYYGPFSSGRTVNRLLKDIGEKFKLRKCDYKKLKAHKDHSICMYYEMGRCNAPCNLTQSLAEYRDEVNTVHNFITSTEPESVQRIYLKKMEDLSEQMDYESAAFIRDRLKDIQKVLSYHKVITSAINNKKLIIKCDDKSGREVFFIHNGKLVETYVINEKDEFDQRNAVDEITEATDYLFFSLSKFVKHKYNPEELDEIKVISNWLALNRDRNRVMEINDRHTKKDIVNFVFG